MKRLLAILILPLFSFFIFNGCQQKENTQNELAKVEKVFQSYFDGISKFDYETMRQACSRDYLLFEDGTVWTVEDHINFLKSLEGKGSIKYKFTDVKKNIDGSVAWITHRNIGDAIIDSNQVHFEWIESAVFHRQNDEWKMVLLHSTTAKPLQKD
jgi:hypothetical protein